MGDTLCLTGGRVVDPSQGLDAVADVLIRDGRVVAVGPDLAHGEDARVIPASNAVVAPGFVDLHCHLRVPGQEHKETLASGLGAAAAGGFTTVCCMPNTTPPIDRPAAVTGLLDAARAASPLTLHVIAAVTANQEGRALAPLADLAEAGAVAFSDDGRPVWDGDVMRRALRLSAELGLPLSVHEEDPDIAAGGVADAGAVAERLGLRSLSGRAEEAMIARDIGLLRRAGGQLHIAHVSTAGSVELVRAAQAEGLRVSAEATPHHLTLTDAMVARPWDGHLYDTRAKVNPPLRTRADVDAVVAGLADGTIGAIATDHAPHALAEKRQSFAQAPFGISVFETALASVLALWRDGKVALTVLVERLTRGPARLFGLDAGTLRPGSRADVVIFDPDATWTVDAARFVSRGRNTPLDGATMRGRVLLTLAGGAVAYQLMDAA